MKNLEQFPRQKQFLENEKQVLKCNARCFAGVKDDVLFIGSDTADIKL